MTRWRRSQRPRRAVVHTRPYHVVAWQNTQADRTSPYTTDCVTNHLVPHSSHHSCPRAVSCSRRISCSSTAHNSFASDAELITISPTALDNNEAIVHVRERHLLDADLTDTALTATPVFTTLAHASPASRVSCTPNVMPKPARGHPLSRIIWFW